MSTNNEELDKIMENVRNDTLDSTCSVSVPSHHNHGGAQIPDFAITYKVSFPQSKNTSCLSHLTRKVTYVGYPLLTKLKAFGPHSDNIADKEGCLAIRATKM